MKVTISGFTSRDKCLFSFDLTLSAPFWSDESDSHVVLRQIYEMSRSLLSTFPRLHRIELCAYDFIELVYRRLHVELMTEEPGDPQRRIMMRKIDESTDELFTSFTVLPSAISSAATSGPDETKSA